MTVATVLSLFALALILREIGWVVHRLRMSRRLDQQKRLERLASSEDIGGTWAYSESAGHLVFTPEVRPSGSRRIQPPPQARRQGTRPPAGGSGVSRPSRDLHREEVDRYLAEWRAHRDGTVVLEPGMAYRETPREWGRPTYAPRTHHLQDAR